MCLYSRNIYGLSRPINARQDIFSDYTVDGFEYAFARNFDIIHQVPIFGTERILYLFKNKARSRGTCLSSVVPYCCLQDDNLGK